MCACCGRRCRHLRSLVEAAAAKLHVDALTTKLYVMPDCPVTGLDPSVEDVAMALEGSPLSLLATVAPPRNNFYFAVRPGAPLAARADTGACLFPLATAGH